MPKRIYDTIQLDVILHYHRERFDSSDACATERIRVSLCVSATPKGGFLVEWATAISDNGTYDLMTIPHGQKGRFWSILTLALRQRLSLPEDTHIGRAKDWLEKK